MESTEKASFTIIGLVDIFDPQGNIVGQYPVGSVQQLDVEFGDKQVELGLAERTPEEVADDADETVAANDADLGAHEEQEHADDAAPVLDADVDPVADVDSDIIDDTPDADDPDAENLG